MNSLTQCVLSHCISGFLFCCATFGRSADAAKHRVEDHNNFFANLVNFVMLLMWKNLMCYIINHNQERQHLVSLHPIICVLCSWWWARFWMSVTWCDNLNPLAYLLSEILLSCLFTSSYCSALLYVSVNMHFKLKAWVFRHILLDLKQLQGESSL